jgi:hypothetical protein
MILRQPPNVHRYPPDPFFERSKRFQLLVQAMGSDPGATFPDDLTDAQQIALEAEAARRRYGRFSRRAYQAAIERAMNETRRQVVAPASDTPTADVTAAWLQPEGRSFWASAVSKAAGARSGVAGLQFSMGVMLAAAAMRATPHLLHAYDLLLNNGPLFNTVSELALSCEGVARREPEKRSYPHVTKKMRRLAETIPVEAHNTLAQVVAQLSNYGIPVGRYLLVDGSHSPAWAQQRPAYLNGKWDPALESHLRRRSRDAGYVVYSAKYRKDGLDERAHASEGERGRAYRRGMRGYGLTALVDGASGIPLAFDLRDATRAHEPRVLREVLLPRVFEFSPELSVRAIVGDAKYDDDPTHEYLETHFGVHLVAARHAHALRARGKVFSETTHRSIRGLQGDGIAICRAHDRKLRYVGLDAPGRDGLRPGQPTDPREFRSRFYCEEGCGKPSIATRDFWSNLPYFPRTPNGRLDLFAEGRALLRRRNPIESTFSSLQVGNKQCLDGAARGRAYDIAIHEALIALALTNYALLVLRAERLGHGEGS